MKGRHRSRKYYDRQASIHLHQSVQTKHTHRNAYEDPNPALPDVSPEDAKRHKGAIISFEDEMYKFLEGVREERDDL